LASDEMECITSAWSRLEITHAVRKRLNQGELSQDESRDLLEFIDTQLDRLARRKHLLECPVTESLVGRACELVMTHNLCASDAVHLATAVAYECRGVFVDDYHFNRLGLLFSGHLCICSISLRADELMRKLKQVSMGSAELQE